MPPRRGGWGFLALVLAAYGVTAWIAPERAGEAFAGFLGTLGRVASVLPLVFGLMLLAELLLSGERVAGWMGRGSRVRGWLLALAAGMLATGPVYAWYALLAHYFGLHYMVVLSLSLLIFAGGCTDETATQT